MRKTEKLNQQDKCLGWRELDFVRAEAKSIPSK